jgi:hypothetical protein
MSKLLQNPQIIHIISEAVVIIGITFYFSQKTKKLMNHINDLTQRLEDQEDIIQKHEQLILKLMNSVDELNNKPNPNQYLQQPLKQQPVKQQPISRPPENVPIINVRRVVVGSGKKEPKVEEVKVEELEEEYTNEIEEDQEDDLDAELAEELAELEETET